MHASGAGRKLGNARYPEHVARAKKPVEVDPNKLKRERAGRYVTPDGRFAVEGPGANGWYIVDSERENELGLPLMSGPYATLDEARAEVTVLRTGEAPRPPLRALGPADLVNAPDEPAEAAAPPEPDPSTGVEVAQPGEAWSRATDEPAAAKPNRRAAADLEAAPGRDDDGPSRGRAPTAPEPPADRAPATNRPAVDSGSTAPAWLERLTTSQQAEARRLQAILERLRIDDPTLVRREFEANLPEVAHALLAAEVRRQAIDPWRDPKHLARELAAVEKSVRRHLRPVLAPAIDAAQRQIDAATSPDDLATFAWLVALRTASAVFEAIDQEGHPDRRTGEPGWRLLELDGRREPTDRAIALDTSDLVEEPVED